MIYIKSDTIPRGRVNAHANDALGFLFCDHEIDAINIYIDVTDKITSTQFPNAIGTCGQMTPTTWLINVVNRYDWKFTLSHELYHVYQYHDGLPLNERECNQFARMMQSCEMDYYDEI